ncbi:MAG: Mrp/NBP35 family ATP-binding protein [Bacilli bacterium]|jgi:Mrp family chromosome partitioning ATPase
MEKECTHDCGSCDETCDERTGEKVDFSAKLNEHSKVKKVIGVLSGKGGVGKSIITAMLAVSMRRLDHHVAILDADITGPSIPKLFGLKEKAYANDLGIIPLATKTGIDVISINLLLDNETDPVIWRGPIIGGTVKAFWSDVVWKDIDFMFIDMPPGTGDVALTIFQSLPIDGIVVVTSPQELASMIVGKAVKMAQMMNIPIIGIVENMSYFKCPDNGKDYQIFGPSHIEDIASAYNLRVMAKIPIDPNLSSLSDLGLIELFKGDWLAKIPEVFEKL